MINLQEIFNALLQFWVQAPGGTRQQFITALVDREIATEDEGNLYADNFLQSAVELTLLDVADWDVMMTRVAAVRIERAERAGRAIHSRLVNLPVFRVAWLQDKIAKFDAGIADSEATTADAELGKQEILDRFPPSTLRDHTVQVLDHGIHQMGASRLGTVRRRNELADELDSLESG